MIDKKVVLYIFIFFCLVGISIYFIRKKIKPKKVDDEKTCDMLFFYATWCPYSKKSLIEWHKFKSEWNHRKIHGYEMLFQEIDCDVNESMANKYNVEKYPTIKLIKDDSIIDFDAKPTVSTLTQFLNSSFD
jgi:thiol-disulfide isomerase/thioredoxin